MIIFWYNSSHIFLFFNRTCAVELDDKWLSKLPAAEEDEKGVLANVAAKKNQRLGCQIKLSPALEGLEASFKAWEVKIYPEWSKKPSIFFFCRIWENKKS